MSPWFKGRTGGKAVRPAFDSRWTPLKNDMRKNKRTTSRMEPPVGRKGIPEIRYRIIYRSRAVGKTKMMEATKRTIVGKMVIIRNKECIIDDIEVYQPEEGLH